MKKLLLILSFLTLSCSEDAIKQYNHIMIGNKICGTIIEKTLIPKSHNTPGMYIKFVDSLGVKHIYEENQEKDFVKISVGEHWCFYTKD